MSLVSLLFWPPSSHTYNILLLYSYVKSYSTFGFVIYTNAFKKGELFGSLFVKRAGGDFPFSILIRVYLCSLQQAQDRHLWLIESFYSPRAERSCDPV